LAVWESLQQSGWAVTVSDTGWLYAAVAVTHYFTLFLYIGTAALLDLRILGVACRRQTIAQVAEQILPWNWIVFGAAVLSGFVLFATDATDYTPVFLFWSKLGVISLAVLATLIVQTRLNAWSRPAAVPGVARVTALVSLLLWIGAILIAVDISYIAGVG
jgi:hypothetical protein